MVEKNKLSPSMLRQKFAARKKESSSRDDLDTLRFLSTPQLSDAMNEITGINGVINGLKSLNNQKISGKIVTVRTNDYDWGTSVKAIDEADKGDVLFIFAEGEDNAVWGELTSTAAEMKGLAGTIIYGACRDLDALKKMHYPVFSKKIIPNAGKSLLNGEINMPLEFNGYEVNPGDYVLGDECGVVVVPKPILSEVIEKTSAIKSKEITIRNQLKSGKSLLNILGLD
ncbi:RraA family protein [Methanobacterium alcaliphilum]|uniref:RraA family protein n=1 Tax=Methanobacterium alcaliphilum TaxID=392018 RepID=UPI002009F5E9|nr:RraA family protein [Methanobacterium alcaliphilum]MCK9150951.1 RraA family protein [Methanobacterium alcaliphilum]